MLRKLRHQFLSSRFVATLLVTILPFITSTLFAQTVDTGGFTFKKTLFNVPPSDYSFQMLANIFGEFNGLLGGTAGILNTMFKTFNEIMMALALIVILYTVVMSIINTAHQGEFLGKKMDSMWVPVRTVLGFLLIIPTPSGYSLIQVIMMWAVIQGIGAADTVWNITVDYLSGASQIGKSGAVGVNILPVRPDLTEYVNQAGQVLHSTICVYEGYYQYGYGRPTKDGSLPPKLSKDKTNMYFDAVFKDKKGNKAEFHGYNFNCIYPKWPAGEKPDQAVPPDCGLGTVSKASTGKITNTVPANCGIIKWSTQIFPPKSKKKNTFNTPPVNKPTVQAFDDQFGAMIDAFMPVAYDYIYTQDPLKDSSSTPLIDQATALSDALQDIQVKAADSANKSTKSQDSSSTASMWSSAKNLGWSQAGSYYYEIAKINNWVNGITTLKGKVLFDDEGVNQDLWNGAPTNQPINNFIKSLKPDPGDPASGQTAEKLQLGGGSAQPTTFSPKNFGWLSTLLTKMLIKPLLYTIDPGGHATDFFSKGFLGGSGSTKQAVTVNPLIRIQLLGTSIVTAVETVWVAGLVYVFAFGAILGMCSAASSTSLVFNTFVRLVVLPLMFLMGMLLISGLTMQIYIPLVPYIIFSFGVIGWLIGVIETIMAAPLVALGITHPTGHEVFGRAEPALMLITNVFVRPTFMIFGLIAGMIISYVAVRFINFSFGNLVGDVGTGAAGAQGSTFGYVQLVGFMIIYVSLIIAILNKSFSLITVLPDQVLRWIGNQHQFGEYSKGEDQVKQSFSGGAQAMKGVADKGTGAAESKTATRTQDYSAAKKEQGKEQKQEAKEKQREEDAQKQAAADRRGQGGQMSAGGGSTPPAGGGSTPPAGGGSTPPAGGGSTPPAGGGGRRGGGRT